MNKIEENENLEDNSSENKLSQKKIESIKKYITSVENYLDKIKNIIYSQDKGNNAFQIDTKEAKDYIEGIFDGQVMTDKNKKIYQVPENYASKSKLVSGDTLKLVIAPNGTFVYKQISPIPRIRATGTLRVRDDEYQIEVGDKFYNVLKASVTYYKAQEGDKMIILIPEKDINTKWAAVENKIK
jgi:hypothetical protein